MNSPRFRFDIGRFHGEIEGSSSVPKNGSWAIRHSPTDRAHLTDDRVEMSGFDTHRRSLGDHHGDHADSRRYSDV